MTPPTVTLREAMESDYETLKEWFEDRENSIYFTSELRTMEEYKKMYYLMALRDRKNSYYMIESDDVDHPIGFIALITIDYGDGIGQLWYLLGDKSQRGRGVMTAALEELLEIARDDLKLHSIWGWIVEGNIASIKVLEKCGFQRIGVQRESYYFDGQYKDRIIYDKLI